MQPGSERHPYYTEWRPERIAAGEPAEVLTLERWSAEHQAWAMSHGHTSVVGIWQRFDRQLERLKLARASRDQYARPVRRERARKPRRATTRSSRGTPSPSGSSSSPGLPAAAVALLEDWPEQNIRALADPSIHGRRWRRLALGRDYPSPFRVALREARWTRGQIKAWVRTGATPEPRP